MPATEKCCQCLNAFSIDKLPRKLPRCSHNICEPCLKEIIEIKQDMLICGFCASVLRKEEIKIFPLNSALLLLINKTDPVDEPTLNEEDNQLLAQQDIEELCPAHKVLMDIVCITDKHRICPHCALFGNHREHRFKRLEDFEKEIIEKREEFEQLQGQKRKLMSSDNVKIYEKMKQSILARKKQLEKELQKECEKLIKTFKQAKEQLIKQIQLSCKELQQYFISLPSVSKFQKSKTKISKWEQSCLETMRLLDHTSNCEERLSLYYDGPLEIVTQGLVFMEQLNRYGNQALNKLQTQIAQLQFSTQNPEKMFQKCFVLKKTLNISPNNTQDKQDQPSQVNPFIDCTASEIHLGPISIINTTTQAEPKGITRHLNNEKPPRSSQTPKRQQLAANKSVDKQKLRNSAVLNKLNQANTPKLPVKRRTSELASSLVQLKLHKNLTAQTMQQTQKRRRDVKSPEKIYLQFSKNTLSDFFDISQCNLSSDAVVEYVHRARKVHKIRGLKLCGNHLTTAGFQRMIEFLQGVSNINMAGNIISETIFDCIVRNRERLDSLKILNLSHNPITLDKKATAKLEQVKKLGIVIVL